MELRCRGDGGYWRDDLAGRRWDPCLECKDCTPAARSLARELRACLETDEEQGFFLHSVRLVSHANMASRNEILAGIKALDTIIDTGYYDDEMGNMLLKQIRTYLLSKVYP